jgi:hypothetical protein
MMVRSVRVKNICINSWFSAVKPHICHIQHCTAINENHTSYLEILVDKECLTQDIYSSFFISSMR